MSCPKCQANLDPGKYTLKIRENICILPGWGCENNHTFVEVSDLESTLSKIIPATYEVTFHHESSATIHQYIKRLDVDACNDYLSLIYDRLKEFDMSKKDPKIDT